MTTSSQAPTTNGVADRAERLGDQLDQAATLAKEAANEGIKTMRRRASDLYQAGAGKAAALKDGTAEYVRENPIKTVLLAVGVGALVGILLTRRG